MLRGAADKAEERGVTRYIKEKKEEKEGEEGKKEKGSGGRAKSHAYAVIHDISDCSPENLPVLRKKKHTESLSPWPAASIVVQNRPCY